DNRAFNRLYDFVGHRAKNELAWAMGFDSVRVRHRMYDVDDEAVRRTTAKLELRPKDSAAVIVPQRTSDLELPAPLVGAGLQIGEARRVKGKRIDGAMDFTAKNAVTLRDLHRLALALARPDLPGVAQLGISAAHREVLVADMTELAPEARYKPMREGVARVVPAQHLRYVSKAGRAFGFHVDNAYIEDGRSGRAMAVTAVLYVNADGVLDDDRYEYDTVSFPFFVRLGEALAKAVLTP
ncbi:MAG TPA: serine hydrolase, partial [Nannocystaceae bacterium]|nr:serine hydrolase [Nannocystaceae bacterium]